MNPCPDCGSVVSSGGRWGCGSTEECQSYSCTVFELETKVERLELENKSLRELIELQEMPEDKLCLKLITLANELATRVKAAATAAKGS